MLTNHFVGGGQFLCFLCGHAFRFGGIAMTVRMILAHQFSVSFFHLFKRRSIRQTKCFEGTEYWHFIGIGDELIPFKIGIDLVNFGDNSIQLTFGEFLSSIGQIANTRSANAHIQDFFDFERFLEDQ